MTLATTLLSAGYWALTTLLTPQIPPPQANQAKSAGLRAERDAILAGERKRLHALSDRLRAGGKAAEADEVASGSADGPAADGSSRFNLLPEVVEARPRGLANVEVGRAGQAEADAIRADAARALFDLAARSARPPGSSFALADECLRGVLDRLSDHAEARRLLGFVPRNGGWATPYAAKMLADGNVLDPTYGWVPADWVPHLRRGELPTRDRKGWLPAAEADALRGQWATAWQIPTEHFFIRTNVPLSQAISFGRKLEALHQLFFALMADVLGPENLPLAQRYRNPKLQPALPGVRKPFQVYFFATRDEYAEFLAPFQGEGARKSLGTYVPRKESKQFGGVSYFFNDVGGQLDVTQTLFHEASHQLLFESAGPDDHARNVGNYWFFEGLGTYFETLQLGPDGSLRIGGLVGARIAQAKRRLVQQQEFIPIEPFVAMNQARFWEGDFYLHYAEAMALAVFLMQADGERHREGFLDYVRDAYRGRFRGGSGRILEDRVGIPYPELDKAFLDYLEHGPRPRT